MPRTNRQRSGDSQGSFDSLLDTMTNVVGILVILLVVTQVGVRDALDRIRRSLPDVSAAQLADLRQTAATGKQELARLIAVSRELDPDEERDQAAVLALKEDIARLREALKDKELPEVSLDAVREAVATLLQQLKERNEQLRRIQEEIARVKALLDDTPPRKAPPPKVVRLPNPRPAPPGARPLWFTCCHNRVAFADTEAFAPLALERVRTARQGLLYRAPGKLAAHGLKKWKSARDRQVVLEEQLVYDPDKLVALFRQRDIGTRDYRLVVRVLGDLARENLFVQPRRGGGETARQIAFGTSRYQSRLRRIDPAKHYVRFLVWPDSFEAYIEARRILERHTLAAGWVIHSSPDWHIAGNFGLNLHGEKAPPPPPPAPPKPRPPPPPPIVLD